jgi:NADH:ubiquinone oxidoreductase subunit 4 (subunit M)
MSGREWAYMLPLVILSLWIGVYPKPFIEYIQKPVNAVVRQIRPDYPIPDAPATPQTLPVPVRAAK